MRKPSRIGLFFVAVILGGLLHTVFRIAFLSLHWTSDYAMFAAGIIAVFIAAAASLGISAYRR